MHIDPILRRYSLIGILLIQIKLLPLPQRVNPNKSAPVLILQPPVTGHMTRQGLHAAGPNLQNREVLPLVCLHEFLELLALLFVAVLHELKVIFELDVGPQDLLALVALGNLRSVA